MAKRKRSSKGFRSRKRGKRSLNITQQSGDIVKAVIDKFATSVVNPNRIVKTAVRYSPGSVNGGLTTGNAYSFYFKLSDIAQYTDYSNLYDQYRLVAVDITFTPKNNTFQNVLQDQGRLFTVMDFDDASALTGANNARGYNNCVITAPWEKCNRRLVPRAALAAYAGAFTSYAQTKNHWFDMSSPAIQHYGVKCWVDPSTTIVAQWNVESIYYLEFKSSRAV